MIKTFGVVKVIEYFALALQASDLAVTVGKLIRERCRNIDEEIERYLKELENLKDRIKAFTNPSTPSEMRNLLEESLCVLKAEFDQIRFLENEEFDKYFHLPIELINDKLNIPEKAHWPKYDLHFDAKIGGKIYLRSVFQSGNNFYWENDDQLNDVIDYLKLQGTSIVKAYLRPSLPLLSKEEIMTIFKWFNFSLRDRGVYYDA